MRIKPLKETLHEQAINHFKLDMHALLTNCRLCSNRVQVQVTDTGQEDFLEFNKQILFDTELLHKALNSLHKPNYMAPMDLYAALSNEMYHILETTGFVWSGGQVLLKDSVPSTLFDNILEYLIELILNFPLEFEILIPLMNVELSEEIDLPITFGPTVSIFRMSDQLRAEKYPFAKTITDSGNDDAFPPITDYVYISFLTYGCGYYDEDSSMYKDFIRRLKIIISALIAKEIITIDMTKRPWEWDVSLSIFAEHFYSETGVSSYYVYLSGGNSKPEHMRLPRHEWELIYSLRANKEIFAPSEFEDVLLRSGKSFRGPELARVRFHRHLRGIDNLFEEPQRDGTKDDIQRIVTSLEWFFQALINENRTFSFIQMTVSLEALLGEREPKKDVTERLADRCAYLIRKNPAERREVISGIKKLYKIRSDIIHQGHPYLDDKTEPYYQMLMNYLSEVLRTEIESLAV